MKRFGMLIYALLLVLNIVGRQAEAQDNAASESTPKSLKFNTVGAPIMSSYTIEWNGKELKTTQSSSAAADKKTVTRKPTVSEWRQFWKTMDTVRIWNWRSRYVNPHVLDGVFWRITIEQTGRGAKKCDVMGSNAYPSDANARKTSLEFEPSRRYSRFVNALLALAGKINGQQPNVPVRRFGGG